MREESVDDILYRSTAVPSPAVVLVQDYRIQYGLRGPMIHGVDALAGHLFALNHPNVLSLIAWCQVSGGRITVMEHMSGWTLHTILERGRVCRRPFPTSAALQVVVALCDALDYFHAATANGQPLGLVYQYLNPHSVVLGSRGEVKLLPPLELLYEPFYDQMENYPSRFVAYVSPESVVGEQLTPVSDLFSVGALLHEMLTAEPLFTGSDYEILGAIPRVPVLPPSHRRPSLPPEVDALVLTALDRNPAHRFASAASMASAARARPQHADGLVELARYLEGVGALDIL